MIAAERIAELRSRTAELAVLLTTGLPRITTFQPVELAADDREKRIATVATAIRAADDLLGALRRCQKGSPSEVGDLITLVTGLRHASLMLMAAYNPDQAWFWTPEWQEGERRIDADRGAGRIGVVYHSDEEFLAALDAEAEPS